METTAEIRRIVEESTRKLLQVSTPPVKYWLLYDMMGKDREDASLQQAAKELTSYAPRVRLLDSLREDGTWPIPRQRKLEEDRGPGPPVGWTYITMLRNLHALGDFDTKRHEGNIEAAFERMFGWQRPEGYIAGPISNAFPAPHYNGYALRSLCQFEMMDDPRAKRLEKWLASAQRRDGGWSIPYIQDMRYLPRYKNLGMDDFIRLVESGSVPEYDPQEYEHIPSCIWTTLMAVRGLTYAANVARMRGVTRDQERGLDFVLDRFFQRNYHSSFLRSEMNWTTLKYPTYLGSGLCALDILTAAGYGRDDERMHGPIEWLIGMRSKDGLWYRSSRPHPYQDLWITETAIAVLSRYAGMY